MRRVLILVSVLLLAAPAAAEAARGPTGTAERLAENTILDLNGVLAGARENLAEVASLPSIQAQDAAACANEVAPFTDRRYTAVGASNLDGDLYCLSSGLTSPVNIADRAYFLRTVGSGAFSVGDFQIGRSTGINAVGLGYPVTDPGGALTGIVLSPLALPWLVDRVARRHSKKAADSLVLDDHGTVLARAGEVDTPDGTNIAARKVAKAMLEEDFGTGRFKLDGSRVHTAWGVVPLSHGQFHVAVSVP